MLINYVSYIVIVIFKTHLCTIRSSETGFIRRKKKLKPMKIDGKRISMKNGKNPCKFLYNIHINHFLFSNNARTHVLKLNCTAIIYHINIFE